MKRTILNLFALALILGGGAHLSAQTARIAGGSVCCESPRAVDRTAARRAAPAAPRGEFPSASLSQRAFRMKRILLNLTALLIVASGSAHLLSAQTARMMGGNCCTSGDGDKCCGSGGCTASASSCEAW